jgi:hypothetical protein
MFTREHEISLADLCRKAEARENVRQLSDTLKFRRISSIYESNDMTPWLRRRFPGAITNNELGAIDEDAIDEVERDPAADRVPAFLCPDCCSQYQLQQG